MIYDNKIKILKCMAKNKGDAFNSASRIFALFTVVAIVGLAAVPEKSWAQETNRMMENSTRNTTPVMSLDNDMKEVLDALASLNPKPIETLSPEEARKQPSPADGAKLVIKNKGKDPVNSMGVTTKDITYAGAAGELPARLYIPEGKNAGSLLPVIVYYHGGGWVIADLDTYDATPRAIAKGANAIVVSVHYRQAPEFKFPAAHEDAISAYKWVLNNAKSFGGDPKRVAVMGESAGGNLAINVAMAARDENLQMPIQQVLIYPVAGTDMTTASYRENENAKPLNKAMMAWFIKHVIRTNNDITDPRLDLVGRADLHGLPSTTLITAQIDPLRSEGQALSDKLEKAGVKINAKNYDGVTHEFFGMGAVVAKAKEAQALVINDLKTAFSK